jgi:hypothetical protein
MTKSSDNVTPLKGETLKHDMHQGPGRTAQQAFGTGEGAQQSARAVEKALSTIGDILDATSHHIVGSITPEKREANMWCCGPTVTAELLIPSTISTLLSDWYEVTKAHHAETPTKEDMAKMLRELLETCAVTMLATKHD